jgi:hypothetical protein
MKHNYLDRGEASEYDDDMRLVPKADLQVLMARLPEKPHGSSLKAKGKS